MNTETIRNLHLEMLDLSWGQVFKSSTFYQFVPGPPNRTPIGLSWYEFGDMQQANPPISGHSNSSRSGSLGPFPRGTRRNTVRGAHGGGRDRTGVDAASATSDQIRVV